MELLIGIAIGTAFSPFWLMLYNRLAKPYVDKFFGKKEAAPAEAEKAQDTK